MMARWGRAARRFSRGQQLLAQGRIAEALGAFAQARSLRLPGLYLHWGWALAEAGRLPEAHDAMQQAMALQPSNPVLPMFLGQIYVDHGHYDTARTWCDQALALNPHNTHAIALRALTDLALGDIPGGYQGLRQPLPVPMAALERALFLGRKSRFPTVLQESNAALQSRLLVLIETYLLQHEKRGQTLFQQLTLPPNRAKASGWAEAMVLAIDRCCTRVVMRTQRLYIRARYASDASKRASKLLHSTAREADYCGDLSTALSHYTTLLQQIPEPAELHQSVFEIYYEQGDFRRALKHLRRLLGDATPVQRLEAWQACCLGELLYQTGQFSAAVACFSHAMTLPPQDYKLLYYNGLCRLRDGAVSEARRLFARAVQTLNPGICDLRLDEMWRVYQQVQGGK